jgi:hypothetical protein
VGNGRETPSRSAKALEQEQEQERSLIGIIFRTAYWVEWWRRFGSASGDEPRS